MRLPPMPSTKLGMYSTDCGAEAARAVGIGAGQRVDQSAFAVIDVSGGGDDEVFHP